MQLVERRDEVQVMYDALVLSMSMDESMAGTKGEMAIDAIFVNPLRVIQEDQIVHPLDALIHVRDVVHITHRDWIERRTCISYIEPAELVTRPGDPELVAAGKRESGMREVTA